MTGPVGRGSVEKRRKGQLARMCTGEFRGEYKPEQCQKRLRAKMSTGEFQGKYRPDVRVAGLGDLDIRVSFSSDLVTLTLVLGVDMFIVHMLSLFMYPVLLRWKS